jgi:UDP-GlcNAc:undecaprenyl-phosphate/decaprenyl-phosphate GlcNAc-1-phosphate transferase
VDYWLSQDQVVSLVAAVILALFIALITTPIVRAAFLRFGLDDKPDAVRKLQQNTVSLGGGLAVFIATCIASVIGALLYNSFDPKLPILGSKAVILLISSAGILCLGLVDDIFTLRGRQKLLGQIVIVAYLVSTGTLVRSIEIWDVPIQLGVLSIPLTMIWLLGAINAVNLIDGADGIASTAGAIICMSIAVMAFLGGRILESIVSASMASALIGFLYFNWPPAKIYLGDAGSMLIGLVVGLFAIWANVKHSATIAFAVPLAALTVPLFDSAVAIVRRLMTGRSIYSADRGHLHHQLSTRFSPQTMLLVVGGLCLLTGSGAIASVVLRKQWIAVSGTIIVVVGLVATGIFGRAEFGLVLRRLQSFLKSLVTRSHRADHAVHQQSMQLQGKRRWDEIWVALTEFAERHSLCRMRLDLNLSWLQEGYHGDWRTLRQPDRIEVWSICLPVISLGRVVGKLEVAGRVTSQHSFQSMESLASLLQDLQPAVDRLLAEIEQPNQNRIPSEAADVGQVALASNMLVQSAVGRESLS